MGVVAAVVSVVAGVGSAVAQNKAAKKQNRAQRRARNAEQRTNSLENARQRRIAIAERRIRQGEIEQSAFNQGVEGSSSAAGASGSLFSDTASNIGAFNTQIAGNEVVSGSLLQGAQDYAKFQSIANTLGAVSSAANAVGTFASNNPNFFKSNKSNPKPPPSTGPK